MTHSSKQAKSHKPRISIIAALAENNTIGINGNLPWQIPADLKHFKKLTLHKPVIMGRKTFASLGKPLPERENIIVSRNPYFAAAGCHVVNSLKEALDYVKNQEEVMIIGGAQIYAEALPLANRLYLTRVHANIPGDTFFPQFNIKEWQEIAREDFLADAKNPYDYSFVTLVRNKQH